jgi:hypothetical protein
MRRAGIALVAAITLATAAVAQDVPPAPADEESQLAAQRQFTSLQEQLVAAQQQIAQLRAENGGLRDQVTTLARCREKNGRLVAIGNELIASYQQRYGRGRFLPFETGRRRFEAELQDAGDRIYDNRLDAGPRRPAAADSPPTDTPRDVP